MVEISDIIVAIENKDHFVLDTFVKQGEFVKMTNGQPLRYVGGFTAVFPVEVNREKWAFRCWHANMGNVRHRFETIANAISKSNAKYLCDFAYIDEGIIVKGTRYPTTRMRWVEGQTVKEYICANASDSQKLNKLAHSFKAMAMDMHKHGFAHGDLQHGNIIIDKYGNPYLVDYDSFYCPELKGEKDIITGLVDYQHPSRKTNSLSNEKLDYFSELIIYTSILAIAEKPSFVQKYQVADSERMLFAASDYVDIRQSKIYQELSGLSFEIDLLLQILELYLSKTSLDELMPFDVLLEQLNKAPEILAFSASCGTECIQGDTVSFHWTVQNYTKILLNGEDVTALASTTRRVQSSSTFSLEVHNGIKKTSQTLSIRAYGKPHIALTANKVLLHQNKSEQVVLTWGVQNAYKISLLQDGHTIVENCNADDSYSFMSGTTSTSFALKVVGLDRKVVQTETLDVKVCPDAIVHFTTDKEYVFPTIPFTLHWDTQFAKEIKLNGKKVAAKGELCVSDGVETNTTYTLSVLDEFGTKEHTLTIRLLPIPRIESLRVPLPSINQHINIITNIPSPTLNVNFPQPQLRDMELLDMNKYDIHIETSIVQPIQMITPCLELRSSTFFDRMYNKLNKFKWKQNQIVQSLLMCKKENKLNQR